MTKVLNSNFQAGSKKTNEPRLVGDILAEMFSSDSPLAKALRLSVASHKYAAAERKANAEDADAAAEWKAATADNSGWFRNTELCVDLKTFLFLDPIAKIGKVYKGLLRRDSDDHFLFLECRRSASANANIRNPHVFNGKYISVTRSLKDGHVRFNFKEVKFGAQFNPVSFALGVMNEALKALMCLGEEVYKTPKHVG